MHEENKTARGRGGRNKRVPNATIQISFNKEQRRTPQTNNTISAGAAQEEGASTIHLRKPHLFYRLQIKAIIKAMEDFNKIIIRVCKSTWREGEALLSRKKIIREETEGARKNIKQISTQTKSKEEMNKIEEKTTKQKVLDRVSDLVTSFVYYDRKEDEELDVDQLNEAIESGEVTVNEIVEKFKRCLLNVYGESAEHNQNENV